MSVIRKMRKGYCVYWPAAYKDNYGHPVNANPVEIRCRWEDSQQEFFDKEGNVQVSKSVVYVDRVMKMGDILWNGRLVNVNPSGNPYDNRDASEILGFSSLPNFKYTETLYTAFLGMGGK